MLYDVQEKAAPQMLVASVTRTASTATIGKEIQEAFATLMAAVGPVGYGDGMPGVICYELGDDHRDGTWEVFMPVAHPFEPPTGIQVKTFPAVTVAFTRHFGVYETLPDAHEAVAIWIHDNRRRAAGPARELYMNDPREAGEENAITEVQVPIT
jgi:effector-binding domain-containing protein